MKRPIFPHIVRRRSWYLALIPLLLAGSCSSGGDDPAPEPETPAVPTDVTLSTDTEQPVEEIAFTATGAWHIEVTETSRAAGAPDWVAAYPTEGNPGDVKLTVVAQPNMTGQTRTAVITLHDGSRIQEYSLVQAAAASVTAGQTLYPVMPDARTLEIAVTANTAFRAQISPYDGESCSWLELTGDPGARTLTFRMSVNDRLKARYALVEFLSTSSGRQLGYCIVKQAGIRTVEGHEKLDIPDAAFKSYLLQNHDTDRDGEMSRGEMSTIEYLNCADLGIASLEGIEYCDNLLYLDCSRNAVTELNVTECTKLQSLNAAECSLTFMHLSNNRELTEIRLHDNPLQTILLGILPNLRQLVVSNTRLASLDVSGCRALELLSASNCRLATINLQGCKKLESLYLGENELRHLDLRSYPDLKEYEAHLTNNPKMESIHADVAPSYSPTEPIVLWYTETGKHCMYKPYVYVRGKLISQQIDVSLDFPIP